MLRRNPNLVDATRQGHSHDCQPWAGTLVSVGTHGECGGRVLGPTHGGRRESWVRAVGGYRPCHPKTQLCVREAGLRPPGAHRARRAQLHPPASCLVPKQMGCPLGAGAASPSPATGWGVRWGDAPHLVGLLSWTATRELDAAPHRTPTISAALSRAPVSLALGSRLLAPLLAPAFSLPVHWQFPQVTQN